jgi:hypothetical protein
MPALSHTLQSSGVTKSSHVVGMHRHQQASLACGSDADQLGRLALALADDPLVGSIAQQYLTDKEAHDKTAAEWTKRYAQG